MNLGHLFVWVALLVAEALAEPTNPVLSSRDTDDFDVVKEVTFYLYTQGNPTEAEFITLDADSTSPSFDPAHPTRVVIHGARCDVEVIQPFREGYIATGDDYNVILVDWSGPAALDEDVAKYLAVLVGDYIGEVLNHMINDRGLDTEELTIIGISMGGHVAAMVGNRVGGIASEVVGLDPASDVFDDFPLKDQLDPSDGKFVQVLHTNAGGLGTDKIRGHADFFINGGEHQLACELLNPQFEEICSHVIVADYYVESIASKDFVASFCSSYDDYIAGACKSNDHIVMGEWTPHTVNGVFYVDTNAKYPYAKGETDL